MHTKKSAVAFAEGHAAALTPTAMRYDTHTKPWRVAKSHAKITQAIRQP